MRSDDIERVIGRSMRRQLTTAALACVVLIGGLGGVGAYAEISGAVIGSGKIITEGRPKFVQHLDGGIIGEILVREGDAVEAGQILFRLDGTMARANIGIIDTQLEQLLSQEARLLAEQARLPSIEFPDELLTAAGDRPRLLMEGQRKLMDARRLTREGKIAQLGEQAKQYLQQIAALDAQRAAIDDNITLLDSQIEDFTHLHSRGLMVDSQMTTVQRERASLLGSQATIAAEISEVHQAISEAELKKVQVDEEFDEGILTELDQKRTEIAKLNEERLAAADRLRRLDIRSPLAGYLHELRVNTLGGIVTPSETLVTVIPSADMLIVEAKLSPADVDQIFRDQRARIRLSGLNQKVTPELWSTVLHVSPDLMIDEAAGTSFYVARLAIDDDELSKLGDARLKPGMPADVLIETSSRSVLSYLVKPIADQLNRAMREE